MNRQRWVLRSSFGMLAVLAGGVSGASGQEVSGSTPGSTPRPQQAAGLDGPVVRMVPPRFAFPPGWRRPVAGPVLGRNAVGPVVRDAAPAPATVPGPTSAGGSSVPGVADNPPSPPPAQGDLEITVDLAG